MTILLQKSKERGVAIGTVKWFNPTKGYGFIQPESGGKDVFVHISAVERAGLTSLNEGARVSYEEQERRGKVSAENLRVG
jgi:cold shock protein